MSRKAKLVVHGLRILIATSLAGCSMSQGIFRVDRCADVPCGAIPNKPGSHLCEWQQSQVRSASTDLGVFYHADFIGDSDRLGPAAEQQVARLVQQGSIGSTPLVLEPSDDPQRDVARVIMIANAFTAAGVPVSADQIRIANPPALGLEGYRAQQVARTASRNGNQGGGGQNLGVGSSGAATGSGGASGLGGFGGGGIF